MLVNSLDGWGASAACRLFDLWKMRSNTNISPFGFYPPFGRLLYFAGCCCFVYLASMQRVAQRCLLGGQRKREKVARTRKGSTSAFSSSSSASSCSSSASARKFLYSRWMPVHRRTHNSSLKRNNFLFLPTCRWSRFPNSHARSFSTFASSSSSSSCFFFLLRLL